MSVDDLFHDLCVRACKNDSLYKSATGDSNSQSKNKNKTKSSSKKSKLRKRKNLKSQVL